MVDRPVRAETRTDYVGSYQAYVYADGHVETDPPNRPLSKEDMQRARLTEFAQANAARYALKTGSVQAVAGTPSGVLRDRSFVTARSVLLASYNDTQQAFATIAQTGRTTKSDVARLVSNVGTGGPLRA